MKTVSYQHISDYNNPPIKKWKDKFSNESSSWIDENELKAIEDEFEDESSVKVPSIQEESKKELNTKVN